MSDLRLPSSAEVRRVKGQCAGSVKSFKGENIPCTRPAGFGQDGKYCEYHAKQLENPEPPKTEKVKNTEKVDPAPLYKREASPNLVVLGADWKPHCSEHGTMLKVSPNPACLYRCPTCGVGVDLTDTTEFIKWNLAPSTARGQ